MTLKSINGPGLIRFLASGRALFWLVMLWVAGYIMTAIWVVQARVGFLGTLKGNQVAWVVVGVSFLVYALNLWRVGRAQWRRGKVQLLLWVFLPTGLFVFLVGCVISLQVRSHEQIVVTGVEGIIKASWENKDFKVTAMDTALDDRVIDDGGNTWGLLKEAHLVMVDRSAVSYRVGMFPPKRINDTYYRIMHLGYAPTVRFLTGPRVFSERRVGVRLLPLGNNDYFEVPGFPYRFLVSLRPEKSFSRDDKTMTEYNLERPVFHVKVLRNEMVQATGDAREGVNFGRYTLQIPDHGFWFMVSAVRDAGVPVIHYGLLLIAVGLPLWLLRHLFVMIRAVRSRFAEGGRIPG